MCRARPPRPPPRSRVSAAPGHGARRRLSRPPRGLADVPALRGVPLGEAGGAGSWWEGAPPCPPPRGCWYVPPAPPRPRPPSPSAAAPSMVGGAALPAGRAARPGVARPGLARPAAPRRGGEARLRRASSRPRCSAHAARGPRWSSGKAAGERIRRGRPGLGCPARPGDRAAAHAPGGVLRAGCPGGRRRTGRGQLRRARSRVFLFAQLLRPLVRAAPGLSRERWALAGAAPSWAVRAVPSCAGAAALRRAGTQRTLRSAPGSGHSALPPWFYRQQTFPPLANAGGEACNALPGHHRGAAQGHAFPAHLPVWLVLAYRQPKGSVERVGTKRCKRNPKPEGDDRV